MKANILRKIIVILVILSPLVYNPACKKQAKCGCGKDVLFTLTNKRANVFFNETGTNITFRTLDDPYSTYYFCNPGEMFKKMGDYKNGDELLISGHCYWECNYVYQAGQSSYNSAYYKAYMVQVTDVYMDLYGKK